MSNIWVCGLEAAGASVDVCGPLNIPGLGCLLGSIPISHWIVGSYFTWPGPSLGSTVERMREWERGPALWGSAGELFLVGVGAAELTKIV